MRFIFHLLGILFFLIWIVIGAAMLIGLLFVFKAKPWQALGAMTGGNLGAISGMIGNVGNVAEVVKKLQSNGGDATATFNSLPKTQQDCLTKKLGSKTISDAMAGKLQPSPDLVFKAMECLK
ncbi:MAG: hypothetical protein AAB666_03125 [Patescibacteria group bacterium]